MYLVNSEVCSQLIFICIIWLNRTLMWQDSQSSSSFHAKNNLVDWETKSRRIPLLTQDISLPSQVDRWFPPWPFIQHNGQPFTFFPREISLEGFHQLFASGSPNPPFSHNQKIIVESQEQLGLSANCLLFSCANCFLFSLKVPTVFIPQVLQL